MVISTAAMALVSVAIFALTMFGLIIFIEDVRKKLAFAIICLCLFIFFTIAATSAISAPYNYLRGAGYPAYDTVHVANDGAIYETNLLIPGLIYEKMAEIPITLKGKKQVWVVLKRAGIEDEAKRVYVFNADNYPKSQYFAVISTGLWWHRYIPAPKPPSLDKLDKAER